MLKTKEQRASEKALMDKSPLKTLTLEDFLESERHKLTGTLTPVTPETFAKWKAERVDKKAAEEQARLAKEATGRAMFEKGDWHLSEDEELDDDDDDDDGDDTWNLDKLRQETEALMEKKEAERIAGRGGTAAGAQDAVPGGGGCGAYDEEDAGEGPSGTACESRVDALEPV